MDGRGTTGAEHTSSSVAASCEADDACASQPCREPRAGLKRPSLALHANALTAAALPAPLEGPVEQASGTSSAQESCSSPETPACSTLPDMSTHALWSVPQRPGTFACSSQSGAVGDDPCCLPEGPGTPAGNESPRALHRRTSSSMLSSAPTAESSCRAPEAEVVTPQSIQVRSTVYGMVGVTTLALTSLTEITCKCTVQPDQPVAHGYLQSSGGRPLNLGHADADLPQRTTHVLNTESDKRRTASPAHWSGFRPSWTTAALSVRRPWQVIRELSGSQHRAKQRHSPCIAGKQPAGRFTGTQRKQKPHQPAATTPGGAIEP